MNLRASNQDDTFPSGGTEAERLRYLVNLAVLAPSGHNAQPWRFRLSGHELHLLADRGRALPVVDPQDRALIISCGAALEHLVIAARCFGQNPEVSLFPGGDADHLATVRLEGSASATASEQAMFDAMPKRRTTRGAYENRDLPPEVREKCVALAKERGVVLTLIDARDQRNAIDELVAEGDRIQFANPEFRAELAEWVHSRRSSRRDGMSGASFGMPDLLSSIGAMVIRKIDMGKGVGKRNRRKIRRSPVLAVFSTEDDSPARWVAAGRALAAVLLTLTSAGATAAFINQPVEVDSLRPRLAEVAGVAGTPQLLMRFGYGPAVPASARRPVDEVMLDA